MSLRKKKRDHCGINPQVNRVMLYDVGNMNEISKLQTREHIQSPPTNPLKALTHCQPHMWGSLCDLGWILTD